MIYDADNPEGYLKAIDDDWRKERLLSIRDMFLEVSGVNEGIGHGMLQYRRDGEVFAHLNAQKAFVGVYLGDLERIDPGAIIRGKMNCGKSCLRVRKSDNLDVVRKLIQTKVGLDGT